MYVKVNDGAGIEYSVSQLKADNANVSFPKNIDDDLLAAFEVYPAVEAERPTFNIATQHCSRSDTATLVDNVWTFGWSVSDKTSDEISAYESALAADVRSRRDHLLSLTDWMGLSDVTMSAEWATYRQSLRDITAQDGFPHTVTWPDEPA